MEKIIIKNFGGLENSEIVLNKINVFIGKQASGKSVTAKLIYFFKSIITDIFTEAFDNKTKEEVNNLLFNEFESSFPSSSWPAEPSEIFYYFNEEHYIKIQINKLKLEVEYSKPIIELFDYAKGLPKRSEPKDLSRLKDEEKAFREYIKLVREKLNSSNLFSYFIPAGRSFFSILESRIFSIMSLRKTTVIDPFLIKFGSFYESIKDREFYEQLNSDNTEIENIIEEILGSKYKYVEKSKKGYLEHEDGRNIDLAFASSGQQETLPLLLSLKYLAKHSNNSALFIEEPEAHLFPSAQKKIVELMSLVFNKANEQITNSEAYSNLQFTITTHSPYILSSFNNLVQASISYNQANAKNKKEINKIIKKEVHLKPEHLSAYAFKDGKAESIIDAETLLIYAQYLDSVSEDIGSEFSDLLDLE